MSSDDQATTEDRASELARKVSKGVMPVEEVRELEAADLKHRSRVLNHRLKQANKTMGRQGATIAALRGELARIREENSKIDRGELRRLERFEVTAVEKAERLREANRILHEKLAAAEGGSGQ